ncbi:hypothetical protein O0L34_g770 [Tuta absoluta]|nr:hypothetical protein O0L34_g3408 [Tuta absoluta]KAJ2953193.1 hypothetical protein O0L34_g770 [Tuta absoluta]
MKCEICAESNVGPDHEITETHIKNRVLYNYAANRKQCTGNRKGVVVSCNVNSSFARIIDSVDAKIQISAKPNEEIKFNFTIRNDSKKEDIVVLFIQPAHNKLNFVTNNHGLDFGSNPVTIKPKTELQKEVSIVFKNADVGQYEMPVVFSFRKPAADEGILIIRDVVSISDFIGSTISF